MMAIIPKKYWINELEEKLKSKTNWTYSWYNYWPNDHVKQQYKITGLYSQKICEITWLLFFFQGNFVAVGTHRGYVQVWDVMANKRVNVLEGHTARVGALAWNGDNLSSGSRDRLILQRDVRTPPLASGDYITLIISYYEIDLCPESLFLFL